MPDGLRLIAERYRLMRLLGSGGMGRVWLARDEVLRRDVAVKEVVFPAGMTRDEREEMCLRTLREARAAGRLSHPNVVQIYDVVEAEDRPWIVMEYVPSRSLFQLIRRRGPLPPREVAKIGLSVLAGLTAAHDAGVLHRDVKPGNVLITEDGRVVLTDFGLATFDGGEGSVTRSGLILGSAQYIAPERARDGASSPASDLWSLGATLYAAVEGRSPYARSTSMATLTALATGPPDPPQRAGPLKGLLNGLLRKNPRTRFDAAQAERLLRRVATGRPRGRDRTETTRGFSRKLRETPADAHDLPVAVAAVREAEPIHKIVTPELLSIVDRRYRRRRRWPWVAAAAVVLLVPGLALVLDMQAGSGPRGQGSTPPGSAQSPTPTPATAAAGVLACTTQVPERELVVPSQVPLRPGEQDLAGGFVWHRETNGLRIAAAPGWGRSTIGESLLCFRERDGARAISVQRIDRPAGAIASAWDRLEAPWRAAANMADYRRVTVGLGALEGSADLEYTFDGPNGTPMHGRSMLVATSPTTAYIISFIAKEIDWTALATQYLMVVGSFSPADESG